MATMAKAGYGRTLDGGAEYDFFHPVRAGDILAAVPKIIDIYERESKRGNIIFSVMETTYDNQNGNLVAKVRQTFIHR